MRFNAQAAEAALRQRLLVALKQLQEEFLNEIRSGMKTPEGANSMYESDIGETAGVLWAEVVGGAWAILDNYGYGSLMDADNPALADYMASELWNPARGNDPTIRTRPSGTWTDIFGETHTKGGNHPGGYDLERAGKVQPQPPSHAIETAKRWMENGRVQKVLQDVLSDMSWHKFLEERGGRILLSPDADVVAVWKVLSGDPMILQLMELAGKPLLEIRKRITQSSSYEGLAGAETRLCISTRSSRRARIPSASEQVIQVDCHVPVVKDYVAREVIGRVIKLLHNQTVGNQVVYLDQYLGEMPTATGFYCVSARFAYQNVI